MSQEAQTGRVVERIEVGGSRLLISLVDDDQIAEHRGDVLDRRVMQALATRRVSSKVGCHPPRPGSPACCRPGNEVIVLGGTAAISPATDAYLATRPEAETFGIGGPAARPYPEATPIIGSGRDQTAVLVAEAFFDEPSVVGIARNDDSPDALAGGPHVARRGGPTLLTPIAQLTAPPADYICSQLASLSDHVIYGGEAAISGATADAIADRIEGRGC